MLKYNRITYRCANQVIHRAPATQFVWASPIQHQYNPKINQQRSYGVGDFLSAFKDKLKENIAADPDFGGNLQRLASTTSSAVESTSELKKKVGKTVETVAKKASETAQKISEKAAPITQNPAVQKTAEVVKETGFVVKETVAESFMAVADPIAKSKVASGFVEFVNPTKKSTFDPAKLEIKEEEELEEGQEQMEEVPEDITEEELLARKAKKEAEEAAARQLVVQEESPIRKLKEKASETWQEWGSGDTRLALYIEKIDSLASSVQSFGTSAIGKMVREIRKLDHTFTAEEFQLWVHHEVFPKIVGDTDPKDEIISKHTGEVIHGLFKNSKEFPLKYYINSSHCDMYVLPEESPLPGFMFRIGAQVYDMKEGESEMQALNIIATMVVKLNERNVWQVTGFGLERNAVFF